MFQIFGNLDININCFREKSWQSHPSFLADRQRQDRLWSKCINKSGLKPPNYFVSCTLCRHQRQDALHLYFLAQTLKYSWLLSNIRFSTYMFRTPPIFVIVKDLSKSCSNNEEKGGQQQMSVWQPSKNSKNIYSHYYSFAQYSFKCATNTFPLYSNL